MLRMVRGREAPNGLVDFTGKPPMAVLRRETAAHGED
jgi:hypothetical protein